MVRVGAETSESRSINTFLVDGNRRPLTDDLFFDKD